MPPLPPSDERRHADVAFVRPGDAGAAQGRLRRTNPPARLNDRAFGSLWAEGRGFEPRRRLPAYTLSRRAPSSARASLRGDCTGPARAARRPRGYTYCATVTNP